MVGPSSVSPAFYKSLLHFCCTDSEQRGSPSSRMGTRNSSVRFRARGGLPIAPPALLSVREVARHPDRSGGTPHLSKPEQAKHDLREERRRCGCVAVRTT